MRNRQGLWLYTHAWLPPAGVSPKYAALPHTRQRSHMRARSPSSLRICAVQPMHECSRVVYVCVCVCGAEVVFYAHGFGGHGQRQWELAEYLSSQGFPYFVLDHQGFGADLNSRDDDASD
jgi:alpha-beta hydrolase superfamily lysophospholipase